MVGGKINERRCEQAQIASIIIIISHISDEQGGADWKSGCHFETRQERKQV